jgi:hypothetical protein
VIRMLKVEIRRAWARRLVWFLLLASLGAVVVIAVSLFATHDKPSGSDARPVPTFREDQFRSGSQVDPFRYTQVLGSDDSGAGGVLDATSSIFLAVAALVGASLAGAEYRYGTMTTLLTWEPRRQRVMAAKLVAAASVGAALYVVMHATLALALVPVAALRGTFQGADAAFAGDVAGFIVRGAALSAGLAALGACLATLGRNTSAALGVLFVYLIAVEVILRARAPELRRWFLLENLALFLTARRPDTTLDRSVAATGILLGVYLAGVAVIATAVFTRRDVT